MKKSILILFLILSHTSFAQYSAISVFPTEQTILASFENMNNDGFGTHVGMGVIVGETPYHFIYRTPYTYLTKVGINYGFLKNGIVLGAGIKTDIISNPNPKFYPDIIIKLQPIKLLTGNRDIWDISISYDISDGNYIGFGFSIPYRYGSYYK
jgi:hypothetical protein